MRTFTRNQALCIKELYEQQIRGFKFETIKIEVMYLEPISDDSFKLFIVYTLKDDLRHSYSLEMDEFFQKYQLKHPFVLDFSYCLSNPEGLVKKQDLGQ